MLRQDVRACAVAPRKWDDVNYETIKISERLSFFMGAASPLVYTLNFYLLLYVIKVQWMCVIEKNGRLIWDSCYRYNFKVSYVNVNKGLTFYWDWVV